MQQASKVFGNGLLYSHPGADALAVSGDRILAIGTSDELQPLIGADTETIDLTGRFLMPGFIDAHLHLFHLGLSESGWRTDLAGFDRGGTLERLRCAVEERGRGEWVIGGGWDESQWRIGEYLHRGDLDCIAPDSPVVAVRMDGHILAANTLALRWMEEHPIDGLDPSLIEAASGLLREESAWALLRQIEPDGAALREAVIAAAMHCHRHGVTSVHTMTHSRRLSVLREQRVNARLRTTVYVPVDSPFEVGRVGPGDGQTDPWLRIGGAKIFADGSIGAQNAALSRPYANAGTGKLNWSDEDLQALIERAERVEHPTAIHAIGDRAIEQVLGLHERLGTSPERRHRIEHFELPGDGHLERARDAGITVCMQPNFIGNWSGPDSMYVGRLGADRDRASNPLRRVLDAGLALAFGSDGMPVGPLYGLHWAVNAPYAGQRLSVAEALACYTAAPARLSFEEELKGRLEPGMLADVVVLDEDPAAQPERIAQRVVEMTLVGGECVYRNAPRAS
ncbi:amidohydrolase [Candidatus Bipolaricaulota bacterium]|nr:amidohydrolase [Candidatus Bipolaricaulota bacterium]